MLRDPKSRALADSFAGQWLRVARSVHHGAAGPGAVPGLHAVAARRDVARRPIAFFDSIVRDDASLLRLLDADYTYLNEELAEHYGIAGVNGPELRRVALKDRSRGGVLTMAAC